MKKSESDGFSGVVMGKTAGAALAGQGAAASAPAEAAEIDGAALVRASCIRRGSNTCSRSMSSATERSAIQASAETYSARRVYSVFDIKYWRVPTNCVARHRDRQNYYFTSNPVQGPGQLEFPLGVGSGCSPQAITTPDTRS
jgi:hypothetical protein